MKLNHVLLNYAILVNFGLAINAQGAYDKGKSPEPTVDYSISEQYVIEKDGVKNFDETIDDFASLLDLKHAYDYEKFPWIKDNHSSFVELFKLVLEVEVYGADFVLDNLAQSLAEGTLSPAEENYAMACLILSETNSGALSFRDAINKVRKNLEERSLSSHSDAHSPKDQIMDYFVLRRRQVSEDRLGDASKYFEAMDFDKLILTIKTDPSYIGLNVKLSKHGSIPENQSSYVSEQTVGESTQIANVSDVDEKNTNATKDEDVSLDVNDTHDQEVRYPFRKSSETATSLVKEEFEPLLKTSEDPFENSIKSDDSERSMDVDNEVVKAGISSTMKVYKSGKFINKYDQVFEINSVSPAKRIEDLLNGNDVFATLLKIPAQEKTKVEEFPGSTIDAIISSEGERIAVVNFANGEVIGGRVFEGSQGQEEMLLHCVAGLWESLVYHGDGAEKYPRYLDSQYSPVHGLYSQGLKLIKHVEGDKIVSLERPIDVDVISSEAMIPDTYALSPEDELREQIWTQVALAILTGHDVLVTGYFGCVDGKNDINGKTVGKLFDEVLNDPIFKNKLKRVIFATGDKEIYS